MEFRKADHFRGLAKMVQPLLVIADGDNRIVSKNLIGQRYGMLEVFSKADVMTYGADRWICKCDCGNTAVFTRTQLEGNHRLSCGCLSGGGEATKKLRLNRKEYNEMIARCEGRKDSRYQNEVEKGIIVCSDWYDDFNKFYKWSLKNGYEPGLKLGRVDIEHDYEPDNCYWIGAKGDEDAKSE